MLFGYSQQVWLAILPLHLVADSAICIYACVLRNRRLIIVLRSWYWSVAIFFVAWGSLLRDSSTVSLNNLLGSFVLLVHMVLPLTCLISLGSLSSFFFRCLLVIEDVAFTIGANAVQLATSDFEQARHVMAPFYFGDLTFSRLDWFATAAAILSLLLQHPRMLDALVQAVLHPSHLVLCDAGGVELLVHFHLELLELFGAHVVWQVYSHAFFVYEVALNCR